MIGNNMKLKIFVVGMVALGVLAAPAASVAEKTARAEMVPVAKTYDFGNVKEDGGPVRHDFEFVNAGDANLVVFSATAECGCTKPTFPKEPIAPGKTGKIAVTFHPIGRAGGFEKTVTVKTNGKPGKVRLKIRGTVVPSAK